jgi:O-antigen/teichoic acid export membrane protein
MRRLLIQKPELEPAEALRRTPWRHRTGQGEAVDRPGRAGDRERTKHVLYYSSSSVVSQAIRVFGIFLSTSRIGVKPFATFASALMLVGFCNMLRDLGQDPALLSLPKLNRRYVRFHFLITSALGILACGVVSALVWCSPWFTDLRPVFIFMPALILTEASYHTSQIVAQRRFAFRAIALIEVCAAISWLLMIVLVSFYHRTAAGLLLANLTDFLVRGTGLLLLEHACLRPVTIPKVIRYFGRYARILTVQSWIEHAGEHIDVALLRLLSVPSELGDYARVKQVSGIVFSLSVRLVDQVAAATYSAEQSSDGLLRRSVGRFLKLALFGTLAALAGVCLIELTARRDAPGVETSLTGLWWWALPFCLIRPVLWNFNLSFKATSRPRLLLLSVLANTLLLFVLALIFIPGLGARGLFLALIVSSASTVALQWLWSAEFRGPQFSMQAVFPEQKGM